MNGISNIFALWCYWYILSFSWWFFIDLGKFFPRLFEASLRWGCLSFWSSGYEHLLAACWGADTISSQASSCNAALDWVAALIWFKNGNCHVEKSSLVSCIAYTGLCWLGLASYRSRELCLCRVDIGLWETEALKRHCTMKFLLMHVGDHPNFVKRCRGDLYLAIRPGYETKSHFIFVKAVWHIWTFGAIWHSDADTWLRPYRSTV